MNKIYGVMLCVLIGVAGKFASQFVPFGAVAMAIIIGACVGNLINLGDRFAPGVKLSEKNILSFAIALMGVNLNYVLLQDLGVRTLVLVVCGMAFTIGSAIVIGKIFKIEPKLALLLGIGSAVCGSSAIAASEKVMKAKEEDVGLSIATVNFLGTVGIFLLPFVGDVLLHLKDVNSGILIGNTLQAVGQVTAAGFSLGDTSGQAATIVKMARVLMLTPLIVILLLCFASNKHDETEKSGFKLKVPLFIIGFVLFSMIPTFNLLPETYIKILSKTSKYALIVAMAGVGLKIKFNSILKDGKSALLVGSFIFALQIIFSSLIILMFF